MGSVRERVPAEPRDATIPPPAPQPQLKPQYVKEWQDRIRRRASGRREG